MLYSPIMMFNFKGAYKMTFLKALAVVVIACALGLYVGLGASQAVTAFSKIVAVN